MDIFQNQNIQTQEQAEQYVKALVETDNSFHFEDDARECLPHLNAEQAGAIQENIDQIYRRWRRSGCFLISYGCPLEILEKYTLPIL